MTAKQDDAADDAAADEPEFTAPSDVEDAVVEDLPPESDEDRAIAADDIGAPAPITPNSTMAQHEDRVSFENAVNAGAAEFAEHAKAVYIDTILNGGTVEVVSTYTED